MGEVARLRGAEEALGNRAKNHAPHAAVDSNGRTEDSNGRTEDSNGRTEDSNGGTEDTNGGTGDTNGGTKGSSSFSSNQSAATGLRICHCFLGRPMSLTMLVG